MATVIDSLIVTLGLDPRGFKKGQADTEAATKKMKADAASTAKEFDARGKQMASAIGAVRNQVIGLFAAFTAGRGLKEFVSDLTRSDAALGRAAKNIGLTADQLSSWQGVAQRTGGSAEGITASMQGLAQQFQQLYLTGQSGVVPYFRALDVQIDRFVDNRGNIKDMTGLFLRLADAFKEKGLSAAGAQAIGAGLGIDSATVNAIYLGREALETYLATAAKFAASKADTDAAQARQSAFELLGQASESLGRKLLTAATPAILAITNALTKFAEWAGRHRPLIEAAFIGITAAVVGFAAVLAAPLAGIVALSTAIAAAIAGIALLYDDWKVWTEGGKSAFAGFWQFFADKWAQLLPTIRPALDDVASFFKNYWQTLKDDGWAAVALFTGSADEIRAAWSKLFGDLKESALKWLDIFKEIAPLIAGALKGAFASAFDWVENRAKAIWGAIAGKKADVPAAGPTSSGKPNSASGGAGSDIEAYIRAAAIKRGVDPDIALRVARSEGLNSYVGDRGSSFGPYQLHYGNVASGGMAVSGLGDEFTRKTGLDARDPSTTRAQIDFALDKAAAGGWGPWHGWRGDPQAGIGQPSGSLAQAFAAGPRPDPGLALGAGASAANSTINNSQSATSLNHTVNVGEINLNGTNVTDAKSFADTAGPALDQHSWVAQANTGLTG